MDPKARSVLVWDALTAILVTDRNSDKGTVAAHLIQAPKPHMMAAQFILLGSGFATEDLSPTGTYDGPTNASLHKLWEVRYR
jgi:hypothetical protein